MAHQGQAANQQSSGTPQMIRKLGLKLLLVHLLQLVAENQIFFIMPMAMGCLQVVLDFIMERKSWGLRLFLFRVEIQKDKLRLLMILNQEESAEHLLIF